MPRAAQSDLKFYVEEHRMTITSDYRNEATREGCGTHLVQISRKEGTVNQTFIKEDIGMPASSFYADGTLYRAVALGSKISLSTFSLDKSAEFTISKKSAFASERVYTRSSETKMVNTNRTVGGILFDIQEPFVVPHVDANGVTLQIGTFVEQGKAASSGRRIGRQRIERVNRKFAGRAGKTYRALFLSAKRIGQRISLGTSVQ
jgi:hypothetical protein